MGEIPHGLDEKNIKSVIESARLLLKKLGCKNIDNKLLRYKVKSQMYENDEMFNLNRVVNSYLHSYLDSIEPRQCPFCGCFTIHSYVSIGNLQLTDSCEQDSKLTIDEHQCDACNRSFWT